VNFADSLQRGGRLVIDLHAQDVKRRRENLTTDNDNLSALNISRCLVGKMGRVHCRPGLYTELRQTVRFHAKLVRERTRIRNRIQSFSDICFPGFLGGEKHGISDFSASSLWVLENHTASSVCSMPASRLIGQLRRQQVRAPEQVAAKLKDIAVRALPASIETQRARHQHVRWLVAQFRLLAEQEQQAAGTAAFLLRQTPGALLPSVKGIGLKFAFQLTAEIGAPELIDSVDRKVNYFGLTDRSHQSGGRNKPEKKSKGRQKRCNHFGKNVILGISDSVARWGPVEFHEYHMRRKLEGKNARKALARKLLRFAIGVMRQPNVYVPPELRNEPIDSPLRRIHLRNVADRLHRVWAPCKETPEPHNDVIEQWVKMAGSIHQTSFTV
jgi:transposase